MSVTDSIHTSPTQTVRAAMTLRDMIIGGQLEADQRYTETQLATMLSMSRTPIRAASSPISPARITAPSGS
mgnify:CR=1 FL=1